MGTAALVMVGTQVMSPAARVEASITGYGGIGRGVGRIRSVKMTVRVSAKGCAPASRTVVVGQSEGGALRQRAVGAPTLRLV
jgi:hypothetical protein